MAIATGNKNLAQEFQREAVSVGWPWRLLVSTGFLLVFALVIYLGITFGYVPYLESQIEQTNQEINNLGAVVSEQDRESFVTFYSQLANLQRLLGEHIKGGVVFDFIEGATNRQVSFDNFALSVSDRSLRLEGVAANYNVLIQQLTSFSQSSAVAQTVLENSQVTGANNNVRFALRLTLRPEIFR